jgi:Mce-associated membrane protein
MVSGGARQNVADTKLVPVSENDDTLQTAAEMRSLADQAEAEAAEAEALAAAARARARAIQLRREAEVAEAKDQPVKEAVTQEAAAEEARPTDLVPAEVQDTPEIAPEVAESAVAPDAVETEESPDEAIEGTEEPDADPSAIDDAEEEPERSRLRRPRWSTVAATVAVVVILAALAGSVYMVLDHRHATEQRRRAAEFAAAARQGVVTLTSLDFEHAKEGVQNIIEVSTGSFKDDFVKMADDFTKVVQESKVISQGSVQADAVDLNSMTDNSAVVLIASTSEVTNAAGAKQDPRKYRLIVTVARDGGQLKLSKVEFLP